jgi:aminoglycoside phosphotransferase (APT) family kinase protein
MVISNPPWAAETRVDVQLAERLIGIQFPELLPLRIQPKGEGWDNVVLQVNDEYLFRFPRRQIAVDLLQNEARILPKIRHRLPLAVPELVYQGQPDLDFPWPFLGYRFLEGITACNAHLNPGEREKLAPVLAQFLSELHQISETEAKALGAVPDQLGRLDMKRKIPQVLDYLSQLKELKLFDNLESLDSIVDQSRTLTETGKKVLLHGDLYVRHLLIDSKRELCGIIDWGDIHFGDPALDLSVVFTVLPPHVHPLFFDTYGPVSKETWLLARFRALNSAFVTTVYAHSIGDRDLLQEGKLGLEYLSQHSKQL